MSHITAQRNQREQQKYSENRERDSSKEGIVSRRIKRAFTS